MSRCRGESLPGTAVTNPADVVSVLSVMDCRALKTSTPTDLSVCDHDAAEAALMTARGCGHQFFAADGRVTGFGERRWRQRFRFLACGSGSMDATSSMMKIRHPMVDRLPCSLLVDVISLSADAGATKPARDCMLTSRWNIFSSCFASPARPPTGGGGRPRFGLHLMVGQHSSSGTVSTMPVWQTVSDENATAASLLDR